MMKNIHSKAFAGVALLMTLCLAGTARADISSVTVSLNDTTVNTAAQYTLGFTTGVAGALTTTDSILAVFPANTTVPASFPGGAGAQITVNGNTTTASGAGQTLTIAVPADIGSSTSVTVVITTGIENLVNPSIPGSNQVSMSTTAEGIAVPSNSYSITASSTPVQVDSITTSPTSVGNESQVLISTTLGSAGALWAGNSQIVITFPSDTLVTNGPLTGVTVNTVGALSATGNSGSRTITIIPNNDIANGASCDIDIPVIPTPSHRNPTTASSSYTLTVNTSAQAPGTSPNYSIGQSTVPVNITSVVPNPVTIGNNAEYTIDFSTSSDGALVSGVSQIIITFPNNTLVSSGSLAGITVNTFPTSTATGNSGARQITIVPSQNIGGTSTVTVVIPSTHLRNPTIINNFTLDITTSPQPVGTSPLYAIGLSGTNVNVTSVTPNPTTVGNNSQYSIDFNTSADGALLGSVSQIIVTFPADTTVADGVLSNVQVDGTPASASGSSAGRTVTITVPQNIAASISVSLYLPPAAVRNPSSAGNYQLTVATSVQPAGTSSLYAIGQSSTSVVVTGVLPNPRYISQNATYSIDFNTSSDGALIGGTGQIIVNFPADTNVTDGSLTGVTVNGVDVDSATGNSGARTITLVPAQDITANTPGIQIFIPATAVQNPSTPNSYTLTVSTSAQPVGSSPGYDISLVPTATPTATITLTITATATITVSPTVTPSVAPLPDDTAFAYPSPAKGDVMYFYYSVNGPAEVRIEIYNVAGEKGKIITESHTVAGNQRTRWEIMDVAPGLYFYRIFIEDAAGRRDLGLKKLYIIK